MLHHSAPVLQIICSCEVTSPRYKISRFCSSYLKMVSRMHCYLLIIPFTVNQFLHETWKATYIKLRKMNNLTLKVFTAAMFASPILGLLNMDGFALNVFGTTTNGKTTTMQMAASIWGDCSTKSDLIVSPKSTPTALELRLGVLKNLPLIVDDTAALKPEEKVEFQSTLMQMANGKCKDRGKKDLSLQEIFNWKTIIFFTSEGRIDKDWTTSMRHKRLQQRLCHICPVKPWKEPDDQNVSIAALIRNRELTRFPASILVHMLLRIRHPNDTA